MLGVRVSFTLLFIAPYSLYFLSTCLLSLISDKTTVGKLQNTRELLPALAWGRTENTLGGSQTLDPNMPLPEQSNQ